MFYGLIFSWRKIKKYKRFPWITLPKSHLTENYMVSTSATPFIWRLCFLYAYMSPCKANVLWLGIFLGEDRETQKIPLNYALNYAPEGGSDGKFQGKYLHYPVYLTPVFSVCVRESLWSPCFTAMHFLGGSSRNTKDSLELRSRSGIWRKIPCEVPPLLRLSDAYVFHMRTWVLVKPMFYGSEFSWRKIEKHKRFPWIMRWIMLLERHLTENFNVRTSATQFIWRLHFPYAYVSPCKANVLWLGIFL